MVVANGYTIDLNGVVSGSSSGAGKTTLARRLEQHERDGVEVRVTDPKAADS